jgi:hypothetical protein
MDEEQLIDAFSQIKGSPADKAITQILENAVEAALATAITAGKSDSDRAYDCGWAAAIYSFAERLNHYRK